MPQIDPKFTFWFGVWTNLLTLIAGYGVEHAPPFVAQYAPAVQWFAAVLAQANGVILTALVGISSTKAGPLVKPVIILALAVVGLLALGDDARAQTKPRLTGNIVEDIKAANQQTKSAITGQPAPGNDTPLPCTFQMLIKLTPANLLSTIKQCVANKLVNDTQRALDSANQFGTTGKGDADAINCLTPALAIFQAGVEIPAVPAVPAVLNSDGSVKTPEIAAVPAQEPGVILLYQKYREFTLSGALTSCQAWFNGPINATAAAGVGAIGSAIGAAAIFVPK